MKLHLKQLIFTLIAVLGVVTLSNSFAVAQNIEPAPQPDQGLSSSSIADNICRGLLSTERGTVPPTVTIENCRETGDNSFGFVVQRIIDIFSVVVGAVSVIMIIIGGFRYIISGGDSSGVSGAKNTILYAIVGLVIVLFAQVIVRFVLATVIPGVG